MCCVHFKDVISNSVDEFGGVAKRTDKGREAEEGEEGEGGWEVEDDLDLPEDLGDVGVSGSGEEGYFVPPTKGNAPSQVSLAHNASMCTSYVLYTYLYCGYVLVKKFSKSF